MRAYVDANVLIAHLRGDPRAEGFFDRLSSDPHQELWIGALQRVEIVFFQHPEESDEDAVVLARFRTDPLTEEVIDHGAVLHRQWHPSHGSGVNDCLLAAMALLSGGRIYTLNIKHFPMPALDVVQPW
jgi:predicted nucleic acid-binding protein